MSQSQDRGEPIWAESGGGGEGKRRRKRHGGRVAVGVVACVLALLCVAAVGGYTIINRLTNSVRTIPHAFRGLNDSARPATPAGARQAMTILLAGSDIRSAAPTTGVGAVSRPFQPGEQRSDLVMLVHIDADRRAASLISIPRDSWVRVPGHGMMKVNAALSVGGPALMIATVEHLTHVRINHYAVIDFQGFRAMVQALDGVDVEVAEQTASGGVIFHRGLNKLTPAQALAYVRQRDGLPGGDLSRIQRQQNLIRAIFAKTAGQHVLTDPLTLYRLLNALTHALSVDATFTPAKLRSLALQLHGLRGRNVTFVTAPVRGLGWEDGQSVVYLNASRCAALWSAIRHNSVAAFAKKFPATLTPAAPTLSRGPYADTSRPGRPSSRAMIIRWTSDVPSPISRTFASR